MSNDDFFKRIGTLLKERDNPTDLKSSIIGKVVVLQEIIEVDEDKSKTSKEIAENTLKKLNKITNEMNLSVLGDYKVQRGVITQITNKTLELDGIYLIKSSSHSIQGTKETVNIKIEKYEL